MGGGPLRRSSESYRARSPLSVSVRYARLMSADRAASPLQTQVEASGFIIQAGAQDTAGGGLAAQGGRVSWQNPPLTSSLADAGVQELRLVHSQTGSGRSRVVRAVAVAVRGSRSMSSLAAARLRYMLTATRQGGWVHLAIVGVVLLLQAPVRGLDRSVRRATCHLQKRTYKNWKHRRTHCLDARHGGR